MSANNQSCTLPGYGCNISNCQKCQLPNSCGLCAQTFFLTLFLNSQNYGCQSFTCPSFIQNCLYCGPIYVNLNLNQNSSIQCYSCASGFNLIGGYCLAALNVITTTCNIPSCSSCIYINYCGTCQPGYFAENGLCIIAVCNVANCATCNYNNFCTICMSGYYMNNKGGCVPISNIACVNGCVYCLVANSCSLCNAGFNTVINGGTTICQPICSIINCMTC